MTTGPVILMLHGQPGRAVDLSPLVGAIGDRANVIAIDRPGWDGRSAPGGFERSADAVVAALDGAGVDRAVVVGHSYGAGVAAWLAAFHPERVAGLVLISPSANRAALLGFDRLLAAPVVGYLTSAALLTTFGSALALGRVRRRLEAELTVEDSYLRDAARWLRTRSVRRSFVVEQRALLSDLPRLEPALSGISVPTAVVMGAADPVVPIESARLLARQIPAAELIELEGGRHLLPAQFPDRLAEIVLSVYYGAAQLCA